MFGAIATVHAQHGLFMNCSRSRAGEGLEYHLLVIAMALVLLVRGGGSFSIDCAIAQSESA